MVPALTLAADAFWPAAFLPAAFLPDWGTLATYTIACIVLFVTPGPDMSLFLARTIAGGWRQGLASVLGANLGCCLHTVAAAVGLSAVLAASALAFTTLKVVGALYLLWLAFDTLRNGSALNVRRPDAPSPPVGRTFLAGLLVNLTNPKVVLFFITFLPQFVAATDPHASAKMLFLGLYFVVVNIPLSIVMILGAERLVVYLKGRPGILRVIDWVFAGVFGVFAAKILVTQSR
jgi:threonine/homoserine/homoserine lactone efflux protein